MATYDQNSYQNVGIAGGRNDEGSSLPFELWAGDSDIVTDRSSGGTTLVSQFQPVAFDTNKIVVPWDPEQSDSRASMIGVAAQPMTQANDYVVYYTGGCFNWQALVWPVSIDTLAKAKAAMAGKPFSCEALL